MMRALLFLVLLGTCAPLAIRAQGHDAPAPHGGDATEPAADAFEPQEALPAVRDGHPAAAHVPGLGIPTDAATFSAPHDPEEAHDLPAHTDLAETHVIAAPEHEPTGPTEAAAGDAPSRAAASGSIFEIAPDTLPEENYQPDWSRYAKGGLFNDPSADKVTADETPDVAAAEAHYLAMLNMDMPDSQRRTALLDLAAMYQRYNIKPKVAATYERFVEYFPQDPIVPEIYMRLGFLYREIGSFKMALSKFYAVLNASLAINRDKMETYRRLSLKAQMEIADTYYVMGDYGQAAKFYLRLKRLDLSLGDRALVDFKYAYTQFLLEEFSVVITSLQAFLKTYDGHPLLAEARFLLANAYKRMGQKNQALAETLKLLQYQEEKVDDPMMWAYWKKRTGNQLANEFYEQGDYRSALSIYQAMAVLSPDPEWQWPVVYQIGLCFERLRMVPKSIEAYQLIVNGATEVTKQGRTLPPMMEDLREQAQWRLDHLQWIGKTELELNQLIGG